MTLHKKTRLTAPKKAFKKLTSLLGAPKRWLNSPETIFERMERLGSDPNAPVTQVPSSSRALARAIEGWTEQKITTRFTTPAQKPAKKACKHGHPYNEANTYHTKKGRYKCRACDRVRYQAEKKTPVRKYSRVWPSKEAVEELKAFPLGPIELVEGNDQVEHAHIEDVIKEAEETLQKLAEKKGFAFRNDPSWWPEESRKAKEVAWLKDFTIKATQNTAPEHETYPPRVLYPPVPGEAGYTRWRRQQTYPPRELFPSVRSEELRCDGGACPICNQDPDSVDERLKKLKDRQSAQACPCGHEDPEYAPRFCLFEKADPVEKKCETIFHLGPEVCTKPLNHAGVHSGADPVEKALSLHGNEKPKSCCNYHESGGVFNQCSSEAVYGFPPSPNCPHPEHTENCPDRCEHAIMSLIEDIETGSEELIRLTGLDFALMGVVERYGAEKLLLYDKDLILESYRREGMTHEEAEEYFSYNVLGLWAGGGTPAFFTNRTEDYGY